MNEEEKERLLVSLDLLDQIIEKEQKSDDLNKTQKLNHRASECVGESWTVFHLKVVRELIADSVK
tara:strand:- start:523 stop:717 length:195 start_codon:yes stop_codon:yes gene_type:complete